MDEYGCMNDAREDYESIATQLTKSGSVVFCWSKNGADAYVVCLTDHPFKCGILPFGGQPSTMVSVLMRGCFWFDLRKNQLLVESYVGEKLNLQGEDAENLARLLNGIRFELCPIPPRNNQENV